MKRADVLKAAKTQERPGKSKHNRPSVSEKERLVVNFIVKFNQELVVIMEKSSFKIVIKRSYF